MMSIGAIFARLDEPRAALQAAGAIIIALTALRLGALVLDPGGLHPDETQYWLWSRELAWGYFSKPPLIAWIIAFTTTLFGDADWAVRIAAPLLHATTACFLGLGAARLFGTQAGFWTAAAWITLPAVWLSSTVLSTDAPLIAALSAALYALIRLREDGKTVWAGMLGAALGLAFLAKYAAIYFLAGAVLSLFIDAPVRRVLLSWKGLLALAVFTCLITGNLVWNLANDFATLEHTAANANWTGELFNPAGLAEFLAGQLIIVGPILFPVLIASLYSLVRGFRPDWSAARPRLMLAAFTLPPLLIVSIQAFISRAHANWAASAYAAGIMLVVIFLLEGPRWRRRALHASLALHTLGGVVMMALAVSTPLSEAAGLANAFKRVREWPATAAAIEAAAREAGLEVFVFDNRNDFHQFQRYGSGLESRTYMWLRHDGPMNFAETRWPLPAALDRPVLIVSERPVEHTRIAADFEYIDNIGEIVIDLGGGRERRYTLFRAERHQRLERGAAYETRTFTPPDQEADT